MPTTAVDGLSTAPIELLARGSERPTSIEPVTSKEDGKEWRGAWLQAFGAFLIYVGTWGFLSSYGSYQTFYESTLLNTHGADKIAWIGTVEGVLLIMSGIITGPIYDRGYVRELLVAGTALTVCGIMMLSLATSFYHIMLAQGWYIGIGSGILFTPSITLVATTFGSRHRALAICFATSGTAIGGIIYPITFDQLLPLVGFAWATRTLGFITLFELLVALAIILPRSAKAAAIARAGPRRVLFDRSALRDPVFIVFCLALFFMWVAYWVPFFLIPTFAQYALGASPSWAFYLLAITNAATIPGRLLAVAIVPYVRVEGGLLVFSFLSALVLMAWMAVDTMEGFQGWTVLLGAVLAPLAVYVPAILPQLCPGLEVVGTRMGIAWTSASLGIILGVPLSGALCDLSSGHFRWMQILIGISMLIGTVLMSFVWWQIRKK